MKYITLYTEGYYQDVYKRFLEPSAKKVGLELLDYKEKNLHDWNDNTRLKARCIRHALDAFNEDIVWLDADTTLVEYPVLFEQIPAEYDMALYYLDWDRHWLGKLGGIKRELVNSVMMVRNNKKNIELIEQWIHHNTLSNIWEQQIFQANLNRRPDIKQYHLPDEYCAIVDREGNSPGYVFNPVIVQNQISRTVRNNRAILQD